MNVQEIFSRVISLGYYNVLTDNSAMCSALYDAWYEDEISEEEYQFARGQIDEYLLTTDCAYLFTALAKVGLPHDIEARTAIYRDWANRPALTSSTGV